MLIVITKYAGPTNFQGGRIIARSHSTRVTVPWDHALDICDNHERAARMLAKKAAENIDGNKSAIGYADAAIVSTDQPGGQGARVHMLGVRCTSRDEKVGGKIVDAVIGGKK